VTEINLKAENVFKWCDFKIAGNTLWLEVTFWNGLMQENVHQMDQIWAENNFV